MHYHRAQPSLDYSTRRLLLERMESTEEAMEFLARGREVDPTAGLVDSALHAIKAAEKERALMNSSITSWMSGADSSCRPEGSGASEGSYLD
eukprot:CAMPEP_0180329884 /NCGR_PEP_ID=MMETSP0988-20121125/41019_1 /TAXON_ID=697907 /ORGANISM="non described non described, Strain CCMP2293" /LENGTH=91 /DNA_ID=CAMNT_0022317057 /DNA_START=27 /DNA_END=299 /DNA_ORIENTATION=-